ncbi:amino acid permease [Ferrimonas balearica]|uniref:amino acid permease n=1 Tax=Ferrimonas balearica TaxID=44012 RepID=UPI001C99C340|nr:aromatic amino acid transport family protein [Ferrimonas balearica]MBY5993520.1 amino acid permease [Ferrimonas balearica]
MTHSKLIGATLIVAGTSIGAGMLALPIATAAIGFWPALCLMTAIWALSGYCALLVMEVNLKVGFEANLHTMTGQVLGRGAQVLGALAMLALLYALTAAYLTGGASLLSLKLADHLPLTPASSTLLFAFGLGGAVLFGVATVDRLVRLLFALKVLALLAVLWALLPQVQGANLVVSLAESAQHQGVWVAALPIILTSFGFHVCIPTLVRYLEGDVTRLRQALLLGSALPLVCYALWLAAALGPLAPEQQQALGQGDGLANLVQALSATSGQGWLARALTGFADLALLTSFLGVALSLFDYLGELCRRQATGAGKAQTWALTFLPPLALALYLPEGFVAVLGFAALPLVVLMVVLPVLMARRLRRTTAGYQVVGGTPALVLALGAGVALASAQLVSAL